MSNLAKHDLDFADAALVFRCPNKVTVPVVRWGESRLVDIAMVEVLERILLLAYTLELLGPWMDRRMALRESESHSNCPKISSSSIVRRTAVCGMRLKRRSDGRWARDASRCHSVPETSEGVWVQHTYRKSNALHDRKLAGRRTLDTHD